MLKRAMIRSVAGTAWWENRALRRVLIGCMLVTVSFVPLLTVNALKSRNAGLQAGQALSLYAAPGPETWLHATQTTNASRAFAPPDTQLMHVDPAFQSYYTAHSGASQLGAPLTAAFPVSQGWVQFFTSGALLLPSSIPLSPSGHSTKTPAPGTTEITQLAASGKREGTTGIIALPLIQSLLTVGSEMPIGGSDSSLTYAKLRSAAAASELVPSPIYDGALHRFDAKADIFVAEGQKAGAPVGHVIPRPIWQYISQPGVSPDGWNADFGNPLTEAIPFTATSDGTTHHLVAQAFWRGLVVMDAYATDVAGNPRITLADTGNAYLRTLGPPTATVTGEKPVWALGDFPVLNAPGTGSAIIHVGANFPFTVHDAKWVNGALWYAVRWSDPHTAGSGWIAATAMTFTSPGSDVPATASFDTLSSDLASYLTAQGDDAAAVVYDVTRNRYYTYNSAGAFIMASSAKVPIMLTFLTQTESQGREPNDTEMSLLTTMIENSNNDSAQALFDEIGGAPALASFMSAVNVPGMTPNPDAWGWSTVTPMAMVRLLTLLHEGKVLTANDRALALNLMENIESDEQMGVGDTAPSGATVAMKDGWVPAPDDLWAMNTSGIVTVGNEVYIVAVYTAHQDSLDAGWTITEHVCSAVGQLLA